VAVESDKGSPNDLHQELAKIEGVQVHGGTRDQVSIAADDEVIALGRDRLGNDFLIER
jgi:hypothetical protein